MVAKKRRKKIEKEYMTQYYLSSEETKAPLSGAVEVNGLVYLSGQIHADEDWNLVGETTEEKFLATMKRIESLLSEADLSVRDIIRVQLYLVDINDLPALNEEYVNYFADMPMPVRTAVGVAALPLGASLEIDVIAARGE